MCQVTIFDFITIYKNINIVNFTLKNFCYILLFSNVFVFPFLFNTLKTSTEKHYPTTYMKIKAYIKFLKLHFLLIEKNLTYCIKNS